MAVWAILVEGCAMVTRVLATVDVRITADIALVVFV